MQQEKQQTAHHRVAGFGLIELVMALAVLAILVTVAMPSLKGVINRNRLAGTSNEVLTTLYAARMEAIRRNARINICGSTDGASCLSAGSTNWNTLMVAEYDKSKTSQAPDADQIILVTQVNSPVQVIPGAGFVSATLGYGSDGRPRLGTNSGSGTFSGATLRICIPTNQPEENIRDLVMDTGGRVQINTSNGNGSCPSP